MSTKVKSLFSDLFSKVKFKEGIILIVGQFGLIIGSLVSIRVFTEYLPPDEYGVLAIGLVIANLINQILFGPFSNGFTRFISPAVKEGQLRLFFNSVFSISCKLTLVVFLILFLGLVFIYFLFKSFFLLFLISILYSIFLGYNGFIFGIQNALRNRLAVAFHQGIDPWIKLLLFFILVNYFGSDYKVILFSYLLSSIIIFISQFHFLKLPSFNIYSNSSNFDYSKAIINFSLPFCYFGIFTFIHISSDRFALQYFSSSKDVGLYSVLFQLGYYPILIFSNFLGQLITPILYQMEANNDSNENLSHVSKVIFKLTGVIVFFTVLIFFISFFSHEYIFFLFVSSEYSSVSYFLPWVFLGAGLYSATQMLSSIFMTHFKSQLLTRLKIFTSSIGIILNIIGAYLFGIFGIVFSSIAIPLIYFFYSFFLIRSKSFRTKTS